MMDDFTTDNPPLATLFHGRSARNEVNGRTVIWSARFFRAGSKAGIRPEHAKRLRLQLGRLDAASGPADMGMPGWRLHPLHRDLAGHWSVTVSGNWRLTFTFEGKDAVLVDYQDYH